MHTYLGRSSIWIGTFLLFFSNLNKTKQSWANLQLLHEKPNTIRTEKLIVVQEYNLFTHTEDKKSQKCECMTLYFVQTSVSLSQLYSSSKSDRNSGLRGKFELSLHLFMRAFNHQVISVLVFSLSCSASPHNHINVLQLF